MAVIWSIGWLVLSLSCGFVFASVGRGTTLRNPGTDELRSLLIGRDIVGMLKDGTVLEGKVLDVRAEALSILIRRAETRAEMGKGERDIEISRFSAISFTVSEGHKRAILAVALGAVGTGVSWLLGAERDEAAGTGTHVAEVGIVVGGACGGYLLGRHLDSKTITIVFD